eukprot:SAG11_NODE_2284_length_3572_cov_5.348690_1_plen_114_part_10
MTIEILLLVLERLDFSSRCVPWPIPRRSDDWAHCVPWEVLAHIAFAHRLLLLGVFASMQRSWGLRALWLRKPHSFDRSRRAHECADDMSFVSFQVKRGSTTMSMSKVSRYAPTK